GNIHRAYGSKFTDNLKGVVHRLPFSGWMFLAGFLAITGSPPFSPFVSEFQILSATFSGGRYLVGGLLLLMLLIVFIVMGMTVMSVSLGKSSEPETPTGFHDSLGTGVPILLFMGLTLLLGVYSPPELSKLMHEAVAFLNTQHL